MYKVYIKNQPGGQIREMCVGVCGRWEGENDVLSNPDLTTDKHQRGTIIYPIPPPFLDQPPED